MAVAPIKRGRRVGRADRDAASSGEERGMFIFGDLNLDKGKFVHFNDWAVHDMLAPIQLYQN